MDQLLFAWKVVKHVKSNAIVLVKDNMTIGVGAGQMNRVGSAEIAIKEAGEKAKGSVMSSDAFFPFKDTVQTAIEAGVTAIICGNDLIAKGVIESLNDMGLSVPEDVSVIGFDDVPLASQTTPPLTTIRQDRIALGLNGYFVVYAMLSNVSQSKSLLRPTLIERESTSFCKPRIVTNKIIDKDSVMYQNPELYNRRF